MLPARGSEVITAFRSRREARFRRIAAVCRRGAGTTSSGGLTWSGVTGREGLFTLIGAVIGVLVTYGSVRLASAHSDTASRRDVVAGAADDGGGDGDPSADPAMLANAHLTSSLEECSQRLARLDDENVGLERQLEAERMAEADASRSAQARRSARRDPSQSDWKRMASTGTIRYLLPCASFNPSPEVIDRLGLAPRDVPAIQSAFAAARGSAWAQIRPLCATATGSTTTADRLGLDSCPQVILDAARATNPAAADSAMRAVGAVKAGMADPSAIPADDPVGATFLVLTGVARDAENQLTSVMGPDDARAAVFGNGSCGHTSEFISPGRGSQP